MGATKLNLYSPETIRKAELGRAIAAPARIEILNILDEQYFITGIQLEKYLQLDKSTIHQHLVVLIETGLIYGSFHGKIYGWSLNPHCEKESNKIFKIIRKSKKEVSTNFT